jgi:DNA-binding NarL/FixJ family response regulator
MNLAVIDPLPMYQQGVVAVLSAAGYQVDAPPDPLGWAHRTDGLILLTLATSADWDLLTRLHTETPQQHVIAVLPENSAGLGARAVRAGACSVLPREVTAAVLCRTVEATIGGQAVLPAAVATVLATGLVGAGDTVPVIAAEHLAWLRHLAAGMPVALLAQRIGYSERATYRLLRHLYQQLGVRNRIEAIVRAKDQGLL